MAAISDFNDILLAMEQNPELLQAMRDHVLGEELQQLPAVVHQQGELLIQIRDRLMELATVLRDTTEQIAGYALVSSRVIATTVERLDRVESDLAELKAAQIRLEASVQAIRETQARMENDIAELKAGQNRMQGQLNNLIGSDYERKVARRAARIARRHLDLRQGAAVYGVNVPDSVSVGIQELLDQATESGSISPEQADDLERADLILAGSTSGGQSAYAVAEISLTIDEHDVDRTYSRSRILARASGSMSQAIVIGTAISDANRQRAEGDNVVVAIITE